ncbi:MAG: hypothetical protein GKR88_07585 [Flavobacteriaceae bacterium]|nr:MAG: hypothetical protein GKR88_07585 [Flavobacteriaceae bacterium]
MRKPLLLFLIFNCFVLSAQNNQYLYDEAFTTLSEMLEEKKPINFKKAVFTVENAYLEGQLDTIYYNNAIKVLTNLTKAVKNANELKEYNEKDKHIVEKYASLYKVMTDSLEIQLDSKNFAWTPFSYDFEDPFGHKNWSQMFVKKLIDTHKGNCHSLPYLYKIIAEELGIVANLSLSPNHIYIKHRSIKNGWYNTELTSGIFPIDAWIMASGYVHLDAIRNGVYMKALTEKENIALCLVDLAQGYQKAEFYDLDFVIKCANKALEYFPNYVNAMILKTEAKGKQIENILFSYNTDFRSVRKYPKTHAIFKEIEKELAVIHKLGYRQMPEEMYLDWLVSLKEEKQKYSNRKINTFNTKTN